MSVLVFVVHFGVQVAPSVVYRIMPLLAGFAVPVTKPVSALVEVDVHEARRVGAHIDVAPVASTVRGLDDERRTRPQATAVNGACVRRGKPASQLAPG